MTIHPDTLTLRAIPSNELKFYERLSLPRYSLLLDQLKDKKNVCHYCDHQPKDKKTGLYVTNIDGDYDHNVMDNFALSCVFCTYVQLLNLPHTQQNAQNLIYLPHISQAKLNRTYHHWRDMLQVKGRKFKVQEALAELSDRKNQLNDVVGFDAEFKDLLGLFCDNDCPKDSFALHLRWVPDMHTLQYFSIESAFH